MPTKRTNAATKKEKTNEKSSCQVEVEVGAKRDTTTRLLQEVRRMKKRRRQKNVEQIMIRWRVLRKVCGEMKRKS